VEFWDKLGRVLQRLVNNAEYRKLIGVTNAEALDRIMIKIGSRMGKYKESDDLGDRVEANIAKKEVTLYLIVLRRRIIFYSFN
jgi:hypothetical protein